jgi:hypothetical protein
VAGLREALKSRGYIGTVFVLVYWGRDGSLSRPFMVSVVSARRPYLPARGDARPTNNFGFPFDRGIFTLSTNERNYPGRGRRVRGCTRSRWSRRHDNFDYRFRFLGASMSR